MMREKILVGLAGLVVALACLAVIGWCAVYFYNEFRAITGGT
jgi:hypothetical protein